MYHIEHVELTLFHLTPMMRPPRKVACTGVCMCCGGNVCVCVWGGIHVYISIRIYTLTGVTSTYKQMSIQETGAIDIMELH